MEEFKIKIDLLPNVFEQEDGTFALEDALLLCGKIGGECYDKEGFAHILTEPKEKTLARITRTLESGHHSVYDHVNISFNLQNVPKILAMILNNEKEYTTSEKSARYTPVVRKEGSIISAVEEELYNKWLEIFKEVIKKSYGNIHNDTKIIKLAQENARYLVTVFMPTQMIYTTSLRQINYIATWMQEYIENYDNNDDFASKLAKAMQEFLEELKRLNVLEPRLMFNEKQRSFSLLGTNLKEREEYFGDVYSTTYKGSFAYLAQAQRHRTLNYQMEFLEEPEFFIPPIIQDDKKLVNDWLLDMQKVAPIYPQGELIRINERGTYENFILKCQERLCSAAQLEIREQTKKTLQSYQEALEIKKHHLAKDIVKYSHGARCTFPNYQCLAKCGFKEGINLTSKI